MAGLSMEMGNVVVKTTHNCGFPPEHWAERATKAIVSVSDDAPLVIKDQAHAFKDNVEKVTLYYMRQAIASDRATLAGIFEKQGHKKMAEIIRRL